MRLCPTLEAPFHPIKGKPRMRTIACPALGRDVSALGFGCASLGSRLSETQSRRILDYAYDRGVVWYDVAPPDGAGEAEAILGRFLAGRRDQIVVCTKVGGERRPPSAMMRLIGSIRRGVLGALPELSTLLTGKPNLPREKEPLRPELIESSVVESLRRLQTDYVDVLSLRDPTPEDCANPALGAALQRVIDKGYVRRLSIEGDAETIEAATAWRKFALVQFRHNPFHRTIERIRAARPGDPAPFFILRNPLGGAYERLSHLLVGDGGRLASLASQLAYGPPFMASEILLDYAFGNNPTGVVVVSMSQPQHVDLNCARASRAPRSDVVEFVNKTVLAAPAVKFPRLV
jgi:diketogulonate reductase-like aldo/keto reductase